VRCFCVVIICVCLFTHILIASLLYEIASVNFRFSLRIHKRINGMALKKHGGGGYKGVNTK